jgi:glycosidase
VLPAVRERFPDAWFVGEMIHGDYAAYAQESGLDSITQYELWKAIWSSLDEANLWELEWTLRRHRDLLDRGLVPLTFVGNHDVTRIASRISDGRHLPHAIALLAFLPGVPSVYAGDELGLTGVKEDRVGGDDAVRPRLPAGPALVEGADPGVLELHRRLLGVRRRFPWLVDAVLDASGLTNTSLTITARARGTDEPALLLVLNLADEPLAAQVHRIGVQRDDASTTERIAPHGWAILSE